MINGTSLRNRVMRLTTSTRTAIVALVLSLIPTLAVLIIEDFFPRGGNFLAGFGMLVVLIPLSAFQLVLVLLWCLTQPMSRVRMVITSIGIVVLGVMYYGLLRYLRW